MQNPYKFQNRSNSRRVEAPASTALVILALAFLATAPFALPAHAQDVIVVNPVNVPSPVAPSPQASTAFSGANLTPMAPTDPHAVTHMPRVLVAEHNGANGIPAAPAAPSAAVPASIQHAPASPGLTITMTGTATGDPRSGQFYLSTNGFVYTVQATDPNSVSSVDGGDRVRVAGDLDGLIVTNAEVTVLTRDASDSADAYGFGINQ